MRTAERAVAHGAAFDLERDDDGRHAWEVKLAVRGGTEWEVRVTEGGGKVTGKHVDDRHDADAAGVRRAQISAREALRLATGRHAGAELVSLESDRDARGRLVWEVVTAAPGTRADADADGTKTLLDASTGKMLGERPES